MLTRGKSVLIPRCFENWLLARRWADPSANPESGLTLIECLVAIIVTGLVIGLTTPAVVISVATRVNSQKTEQALEVAQGEADRVRAIVEQGTYTVDNLPPIGPVPVEAIAPGSTTVREYPGRVDGPEKNTSALQPTETEYMAMIWSQAREIDTDGDSTNAELAVQVVRSQGRTIVEGGEDVPVAFTLGVRVYDINAFDDAGTGNLEAVERATAGVTGGQGDRSEKPLAVVYTTIARSDVSGSFCDYLQYQGATPTSAGGYNCN